MSNINLHPTEELLTQYNQGQLDDVMMMVLSAHIALCDKCSAKLKEIDLKQAQAELIQPPVTKTSHPWHDVESILEKITSLPQLDETKRKTLNLAWKETSIEVPQVLHPLVSEHESWDMAMKKFWKSRVKNPTNYNIDFVFMEKDCAIPRYLHKGELNLILSGGFRTKRKSFRRGDMICLQDRAKLSAVDAQGCLYISISDLPDELVNNLTKLSLE